VIHKLLDYTKRQHTNVAFTPLKLVLNFYYEDLTTEQTLQSIVSRLYQLRTS